MAAGAPVAGAAVASLAVNIGLFIVAFRLLTPKQILWRDMVPGALAGAAGWTVLQYLGAQLPQHRIGEPGEQVELHRVAVRAARGARHDHQVPDARISGKPLDEVVGRAGRAHHPDVQHVLV